MKWKTRLMLRESTFTALAFTLASYGYYFFTYWGPQDHFVAGPLKDYLSSPAAHLELLTVGLLFGGMIGVINRLLESPRALGRSVGQLVLLRTVAYLAAVTLVFVLGVSFFATFVLPWERLVVITEAVGARYGWSVLVWFVASVVGINLALEVGRLVGLEHLWRLVIGRHRRPRQENRVFLFMDLKDSTGIAERLGHERYSDMLQQCFRDLTPVILRHGASVYQYVGDEVVLSWGRSKVNENASVHAFFDFAAALTASGGLYESRFDLVPEFRGGIAAGPATVIEVGDVKREIVYHGDVLNTAARLLELCKVRGERLVVSAEVGDAAKVDPSVSVGWSGETPLRGKRESVSAYSLQRSDAQPGSPTHRQNDRKRWGS